MQSQFVLRFLKLDSMALTNATDPSDCGCFIYSMSKEVVKGNVGGLYGVIGVLSVFSLVGVVAWSKLLWDWHKKRQRSPNSHWPRAVGE